MPGPGRAERLVLVLLLATAASVAPARAEAAPCEALRFAPPRDVLPLPAKAEAARAARVVDLTGDGRPDLVVLDVAGGVVHGAIQRPDGSFASLTPLAATASDVLVADFDGDGASDAALLGREGPRRLRVSNDGRLELGPRSGSGDRDWALPVALADLDGDGRSEILLNTRRSLDAAEEGPDGVFRASVVTPLSLGEGRDPSLVAGDFDGDGDDDVVATAENYPTFEPKGSVLWGDGRGGLTAGASMSLPRVESAVVADFDGGGTEESVFAGISASPFSHHWEAGLLKWDGSTGLLDTWLPFVSFPVTVLAADFDRDGRADLVVSHGTGGTIRRSRGDTFEEKGRSVGFQPTAAADLDGDGVADLVGTTETAVRVARNLCGKTLPDVTVPVVVSASGANGVRFETEMTVDGRGYGPHDLDVRYVPSFGGGGGTATFHLDAGGQLFFASILDALAAAGVPMPAEGDRGGSLAIRVRGGDADSVAVTTRVVAVGAGRGGVGFAERTAADDFAPSAIVGWLREAGGDRSNLAVVNTGGEGEGDVVLRVTLVARDGEVRSVTLPDVRLAPGALHQWNRVLAPAGMTGAWARVERVSGTAPFFAWGVVNDEGTGDGSFVAGFAAGRASPSSWVVPAVVESGRYATDLVVTNARNEPRTLLCRFVSETLMPFERTVRFRLDVPPFGQLYVPGLVEELRRRGVDGIPPRGTDVVGGLFVDVEGDAKDSLFLGARTSAVKPEGRYGVFYEAFPGDGPARWGALVPAVRQDGSVRTNLAIVNLEERTVTLGIEARDPSSSDRVAGTRRVVRLGPHRWMQVDSVLELLGSGLERGRVWVLPEGADPVRFLAYGITNEGSRPGAGSDDGTFIPSR